MVLSHQLWMRQQVLPDVPMTKVTPPRSTVSVQKKTPHDHSALGWLTAAAMQQYWR